MWETEVLADSLEQEKPAQEEWAGLQSKWNKAATTGN